MEVNDDRVIGGKFAVTPCLAVGGRPRRPPNVYLSGAGCRLRLFHFVGTVRTSRLVGRTIKSLPSPVAIGPDRRCLTTISTGGGVLRNAAPSTAANADPVAALPTFVSVLLRPGLMKEAQPTTDKVATSRLAGFHVAGMGRCAKLLTMDSQLFVAMAEIAGVFVGFGALISVTRRSDIEPDQLGSIRAMVTAGLTVVVAALVPVALASYGISGQSLWFISSLVFLGLSWAVIVLSLRAPENRSLMASRARQRPVSSL